MIETIYSAGRRDVAYVQISDPEDLVVSFDEPFPVLVWNCSPEYPVEKQSAIFQRLFDAGCRYVVAGCANCEQWHDVADEQFLTQYESEEQRDANFVMTTWHTDESEDDVAYFFILNTSFEEHWFSKFLVLQVGASSAVKSRLRDAVMRWVSGPAA